MVLCDLFKTFGSNAAKAVWRTGFSEKMLHFMAANGDEIIIGPTPVNNLGIVGKIVGKDDLDNILLIDANNIRSIPKQTVGDIASRNIISFNLNCSVKEAAKKLAINEIDGGPVIKEDEVVGVFTATDLVKAIAEGNENKTVGDLMSKKMVIVTEDLKLVNAIDLMLKKSISRLIIKDNNNSLLGIVTRTDLIEAIIKF